MENLIKIICLMAGLLAGFTCACRGDAASSSDTLGVLSVDTLKSSPLGKTLEEVEQLYGKKYFTASWDSSGKIWIFKDYSLLVYFQGPEKIAHHLSVCDGKRAMTLSEASRYIMNHLPKGYSVVRERTSNASQSVVFESENPINLASTGAWTSKPGWYCLDFWNAPLKKEATSLESMWTPREEETGGAVKRTEEQMAELRSRPRLGMTLEELKALWGEGQFRDLRRAPSTLDGKNSKNDRDYTVFSSIVPQCTAWQWLFPAPQNLSITAVMWNGRCVGLDLRRKGGFTVAEAIELAGEIVPGISFALPSVKGSVSCTLYSRNFEQGYKLQNWADKGYFELKSSLLVKKLQAQRLRDQQAAARTLAATLKESADREKRPLMGQTLQEVRKILGGMGRELQERWWEERTWLWSYPSHDLGLLGSFKNEEGKQYLHHLVVVDRMKQLNLNSALMVAYGATMPYGWSKLSPQQLKSWFNVKSRDGQQRFLMKWYKDARTGPSLHLVDDLAERMAQQRKQQKEDRKLDAIKNLL
ncbi:hypothetical protein [Akkermansia sp.]|uniref:hypothetical protein n=1 Tax=Akkermansia sp. TaxID=1872421 RepID=UPI0025BE6DD1|nr:hypothetical protein [Akkermansia sp.]MCC8149571.1 transposase [Akkermansia sp.]